jgi:hypothetical protein
MAARNIIYKDWGMRNGEKKNKTYYFWHFKKIL